MLVFPGKAERARRLELPNPGLELVKTLGQQIG